MASHEEIHEELNKCKKADLIDIIITKKVPSDLKISAKVRTILENHEQKDILFGSANFSNLTSTESVDKVSYLTVKNELKCIQIEQKCSKRLIVELERTINNQELIISLLKNDRYSDVNKCHNTVAT